MRTWGPSFRARYRADCHASYATRLAVLPASPLSLSGNNDSAHVAAPDASVLGPYRLLWDELLCTWNQNRIILLTTALREPVEIRTHNIRKNQVPLHVDTPAFGSDYYSTYPPPRNIECDTIAGVHSQ